MNKLVLTLGAAVMALPGLAATTAPAEAGVYVHRGWARPHVRVYPAAPYRYVTPYRYVAPAVNCYWQKQKVATPAGWYWKNVRVCNPL